MSTSEPVGVVLVPGAGLAGNVWSEVQKRLDPPSVAVDFPHRGEPAATRATFDDYVRAVIDRAAAMAQERVVLVAHSIGGVVALGAVGASPPPTRSSHRPCRRGWRLRSATPNRWSSSPDTCRC